MRAVESIHWLHSEAKGKDALEPKVERNLWTRLMKTWNCWDSSKCSKASMKARLAVVGQIIDDLPPQEKKDRFQVQIDF